MDPKIFFPERGGGQRRGKKICEDCPVREECRDYARRTNTHYGIWGGEVLKRWGDSSESELGGLELDDADGATPDQNGDAPAVAVTDATHPVDTHPLDNPQNYVKLPLIPPD